MIKKTKEYALNLSENSKGYVRVITLDGAVDEFVVKLLYIDRSEWQEILRFDSGHGCPHKDILDLDGNIIRKVL